MRVTLDWNCVIEVEEDRPQASHVADLIKWHRRGSLEVGLLAASASENSKSQRFPGSAKLFHERVSKLGWSDLPLIPMPAVTGLCYWDFSYTVRDAATFEREKDEIWKAIAPNISSKPSDHLTAGVRLTDDSIQSFELRKWRNIWCDVISAYSHIKDCRDVFITNNTRDFQDNSIALARLGMMSIATPKKFTWDFLSLLR